MTPVDLNFDVKTVIYTVEVIERVSIFTETSAKLLSNCLHSADSSLRLFACRVGNWEQCLMSGMNTCS